MLVGSFQDSYSPFESSRMEMCRDVTTGPKYLAYKQMITSLSAKMKGARVCRLDVGFDIRRSNISTLLGRTAHILFLQDEAFMRMFVTRYDSLLR